MSNKNYIAVNRKTNQHVEVLFNSDTDKFSLCYNGKSVQWSKSTLSKNFKNITEVVTMKQTTKKYHVDTEKLQMIQMYEDEVKMYEYLKPVIILPNNVTDLKRYRDSARVAFVENIVLADANRFSFTLFTKYLDRVIKYYERYIGATQKLHALTIIN